MKSYNLYLILLMILGMPMSPHMRAADDIDSLATHIQYPRLYERVYDTDWSIDTAKVQQLRFSLNSTLFFRDNEFDNPQIRGYTLPGFRLSPTIDYRPNERVQVEIGAYMLRFWGTDQYPNLAYSDISYWQGKDNAAKGLHALPFFRVQMATKGGLNIVLGSIYGARYHNLPEPLYAPELNLTADPEAGVQLLYSNKWLDFDTWVNWESFIYKMDTHQEAFTFGLSSALKFNDRRANMHVYVPLQVLFQHRGGEIDTLGSVQTLMNASAGLGFRIPLDSKGFRNLCIEGNLMAYNQQVGDIWPLPHGWAWYVHGHVDFARVRMRAGYFNSHKFVSLFGYPFFGNISRSTEGLTFDRTSLAFIGFNYNHSFAPGYAIGVNAEIYRHFGTTGILDGMPRHYGPSTSFAAAVYVSLNPSFLIKSFR